MWGPACAQNVVLAANVMHSLKASCEPVRSVSAAAATAHGEHWAVTLLELLCLPCLPLLPCLYHCLLVHHIVCPCR